MKREENARHGRNASGAATARARPRREVRPPMSSPRHASCELRRTQASTDATVGVERRERTQPNGTDPPRTTRRSAGDASRARRATRARKNFCEKSRFCAARRDRRATVDDCVMPRHAGRSRAWASNRPGYRVTRDPDTREQRPRTVSNRHVGLLPGDTLRNGQTPLKRAAAEFGLRWSPISGVAAPSGFEPPLPP